MLTFTPSQFRKLRISAKVSVKDAAKQCGVVTSTIYNWEHGRIYPQTYNMGAVLTFMKHCSDIAPIPYPDLIPAQIRNQAPAPAPVPDMKRVAELARIAKQLRAQMERLQVAIDLVSSELNDVNKAMTGLCMETLDITINMKEGM